MTLMQWQVYDELMKFNGRISVGMNELNDRGLISDLCVHLSDVAEADCINSVRALRKTRTQTNKVK
tara:strand:- start:102 stop:299 length:198 start_codon:yes stop_codon:yes gene_type:complete